MKHCDCPTNDDRATAHTENCSILVTEEYRVLYEKIQTMKVSFDNQFYELEKLLDESL